VQITYRMCAACDREITRVGDGDGCGACDLVLCRKCLQGTLRCPSCQRALADTRDLPAAAHVDPVTSGGRKLVIAAVVLMIGIWAARLVVVSHPNIVRLLAEVFVGIALAYQLFRGRVWARWVIVVSALAGALLLGRLGWQARMDMPPIALACLLVIAAGMLAVPSSVSRYLKNQRVRHP
jgi:hypothetical protein